MGIVYMGIGLAAVPSILWLFHRLSRTPKTVADEAEKWLLADAGNDPGLTGPDRPTDTDG